MVLIRKEQDGIIWFEFELLAQYPRLRHGVFTRRGGAGEGAFSSLNLSFSVGDQPEVVSRNRDKVAALLQCKELIALEQVHGDEIVEAGAGTNGDGLITDRPGKALMIQHADCQAAIFYDPVRHVLGAAHAGWRGSVHNIYAKMIHCLHARYGSLPGNLRVCLSPSLCPDAAQFIQYENELPEDFWPFQVHPYYFDFWKISRCQLLKEGVLPQHIEVAEMSTYHLPELFFSYRRDRLTGRNGTTAVLL